MSTEPVKASEEGPSVHDTVIWAICPHIRRWSDPRFGEYASKECDRCPESETIDGHEVVCPDRCLAEEAAKAVLDALAREERKMTDEIADGRPFATLRCTSCGRVVALAMAEIAGYEVGDWPRCSGEIMSLEFTAFGWCRG